jgi:hypothetical protein
MAVASFEDLCAGYCEIIKVAPLALRADDHGRVAFHVKVHGATVNLVHCPERSPDHVFVVFELGPAGDSSRELMALLEANYAVLEVHPPMISRNPATGGLVLQYVYPLFDATPNDLHELIEQGCDWAFRWRQELEDDSVALAPVQDGLAAPFSMFNRA